MKKLSILAYLLAAVFALNSCSDDDDVAPPPSLEGTWTVSSFTSSSTDTYTIGGELYTDTYEEEFKSGNATFTFTSSGTFGTAGRMTVRQEYYDDYSKEQGVEETEYTASEYFGSGTWTESDASRTLEFDFATEEPDADFTTRVQSVTEKQAVINIVGGYTGDDFTSNGSMSLTLTR